MRKAAAAPALATTGDSQLQQAMDNLTAQWYNACVTDLQLDPNTFQLVQGFQPIGATSENLWNVADVTPPESVTNFFNPTQVNVFSTNYGAVINNLIPQGASTFITLMGDYYAKWQSYLIPYQNGTKSLPSGGLIQLFQGWAQLNMPPGQAQQAITNYQQVAQGTVPVAVQMWINAGGGAAGTKAYNTTISNLQTALQSAPSQTITMDSSTESSNIKNTWAEGSISGAYDFFSASASSQYSSLSSVLANSRIKVEATFARFLNFPVAPLSKASTDPILSQYQPWFSSAALNLAYQNNNNLVWQNNPPTWNNTFGPDGNIQRLIGSLFIADGINIKVTSSAQFSTADQQHLQVAAQVGFWPFFEASGSGGFSNEASFDDQGTVTVSTTSPQGNPAVFGATVSPISSIL
jgi:hypothetical protein